MKTVLGIDPGLSGGLAVIHDGGILFEPMPTIEGLLDLPALKNLLEGFPKIDMAYLEKVSAMPGQGVSSTFKFGRVYGIVEGMLASLEIPYELVTPQRWMKVMHAGVEKTLDSKSRSRAAAGRLFPSLDLRASSRCRKPHEGMLDALLIAEYGRTRQTPG